jgi:hypothetical protein
MIFTLNREQRMVEEACEPTRCIGITERTAPGVRDTRIGNALG